MGAVATDKGRNVAAATSTGGLTDKLVGRVGDSPIIGAGTYANNRTVAVSCTGTGEVFMRGVASYGISALMEYMRLPVQEAAAKVVTEKIPALGATGGTIALEPKGDLATPHSTDALINGYITRDGHVVTRLDTRPRAAEACAGRPGAGRHPPRDPRRPDTVRYLYRGGQQAPSPAAD